MTNFHTDLGGGFNISSPDLHAIKVFFFTFIRFILLSFYNCALIFYSRPFLEYSTRFYACSEGDGWDTRVRINGRNDDKRRDRESGKNDYHQAQQQQTPLNLMDILSQSKSVSLQPPIINNGFGYNPQISYPMQVPNQAQVPATNVSNIQNDWITWFQ